MLLISTWWIILKANKVENKARGCILDSYKHINIHLAVTNKIDISSACLISNNEKSAVGKLLISRKLIEKKEIIQGTVLRHAFTVNWWAPTDGKWPTLLCNSVSAVEALLTCLLKIKDNRKKDKTKTKVLSCSCIIMVLLLDILKHSTKRLEPARHKLQLETGDQNLSCIKLKPILVNLLARSIPFTKIHEFIAKNTEVNAKSPLNIKTQSVHFFYPGVKNSFLFHQRSRPHEPRDSGQPVWRV